jgi:hypothetical protein
VVDDVMGLPVPTGLELVDIDVMGLLNWSEVVDDDMPADSKVAVNVIWLPITSELVDGEVSRLPAISDVINDDVTGLSAGSEGVDTLSTSWDSEVRFKGVGSPILLPVISIAEEADGTV